jgi:peptidoglycan/LPS O-acetylase OafA/YrhL
MTDNFDDTGLRQMIVEAHSEDTLRFDDGFADRVARRIAAERRDRADGSIERALARQTRRLLPALVAASLALTAWNWWSFRGTADSPIAAALGLQPVTIAAAVGSGMFLGAESLQ